MPPNLNGTPPPHCDQHVHDAAPVRSLGTFGQSVENSLMDARLREVGGVCRCARCCCKPGQGHNHPAWIAYEAEERALERYRNALASGLSDYEAREEGWPDVPPPWSRDATESA
jgi:hypothetical protein